MDWGLLAPALAFLLLGLAGYWISVSGIGVFPELIGPSLFMFLLGIIFMPAALFKDGFPTLSSKGKAVIGVALFIILAELVAYIISAARP